MRNLTMKNALALAALLIPAAVAFAGDHVYAPYPALYTQECASCHVAYPPELMTAAGLARVLSQLDQHFGADASLDARTRDSIAALLAERASTRGKHAPAEASARLTKTSWFVREHRKAQPPKSSFADCNACHARAEKADYRHHGKRD
jgi:cytochrome c553